MTSDTEQATVETTGDGDDMAPALGPDREAVPQERTGWRPTTGLATLSLFALAWLVNPFLAATVLALLVVITVHELGHLLVARRAGMYAPEFMVGFGPTIWSTRRGETVWGLKAIPLGGYVRIVGMTASEEVDAQVEQRAYRNRPWRWKVAVSAAGPLANLVLAVVLITGVLVAFGENVASSSAVVGQVSPQLDGRESPAAAAGLRPGDRVESIDGRAVAGWDEMSREITASGGRALDVVVLRDTGRVELVLTPESYQGRYVVGVTRTMERQRLAPLPAATEAFTTVGRTSVAAVGALGTVASRFDEYVGNLHDAEQVPVETRFLSPLGASQVARSMADNGAADVLGLVALVNIMIGVFNLLPVPPLDGGHIVVATIEKLASVLRRRPVQIPAKVLAPIAYSVWLLLLVIGLSAIWLDLVNPVRL